MPWPRARTRLLRRPHDLRSRRGAPSAEALVLAVRRSKRTRDRRLGHAAIELRSLRIAGKLFASGILNKFSTNHVEMRVIGDTAYDVGTYMQTYTPTKGKPINDAGKYVASLKRTGGTWKIAYLIFDSDNPAPSMPLK